MRMLASGLVSSFAEYVSFSFFAYVRPVGGMICIKPTAPTDERMAGTNLDSCAINAATRKRSSLYWAEYF